LGSRVFAIAICPTDNDVWIATEAGLVRYSIEKNTWSYYMCSDGLPSNQTNSIAFDRSGGIIVGTGCNGVALASRENDYRTWRTCAGPPFPPHNPGGLGLPTSLMNCVLVSRTTGTVYAGTTTGIARSEDGGATWRFLRGSDWEGKAWNASFGLPPVRTDTHGLILLEDYITALAEDAKGRLVIGHRQKPCEIIDPKDGSTTATVAADYATCLLPMPDGRLLVGCYGAGLKVVPFAGMSAPSSSARDTAPAAAPPPLPAPAAAPGLTELRELLARVRSAGPRDFTNSGYVGEDWASQGSWVGRYGHEFTLLGAMQSPLDHYVIADLRYNVTAGIGPHHAAGDALRHWFIGNTEDPRALYDPNVGRRRQADLDDHGEAYDPTYQGPDIWIAVEVPKGLHRLSLYLVNKDGHTGTNRFRDYVADLKVRTSDPRMDEIRPAISAARVRDFWGGVYVSFLARGPDSYYLCVVRNYSLNAICAAVMIDQLSPKEGPSPGSVLLGIQPSIQDEPAVDPAKLGPGGSAATALWQELESREEGGSYFRDSHRLRVLAYRAVAHLAGAENLRAAWRRRIGLWLPEDSLIFNRMVTDAWNDVVSRNPFLKTMID
jgi:hypothetical protein